MQDIEKILNEILDTSTELANKHTELKHWTEALSKLVIDHLADGDQDQKNYLWLQLENNMKLAKEGGI